MVQNQEEIYFGGIDTPMVDIEHEEFLFGESDEEIINEALSVWGKQQWN